VIGCGKSSFVNSIYTLFREDREIYATVGGIHDHVTLSYDRMDFPDHLDNLPFRFWDTWGLTTENYNLSDSMMLNILSGRIPPGTNMEEDIQQVVDIDENEDTMNNHMIHCLLLFMPSDVINNKNMLTKLYECFSEATSKYRINPIVVITKADLSPQKTNVIMNEIVHNFNITPSRIFILKNYTDENIKSMTIDKITLQIISESLKFGKNYLVYHKKVISKVRTKSMGNKKRVSNNNEDNEPANSGKREEVPDVDWTESDEEPKREEVPDKDWTTPDIKSIQFLMGTNLSLELKDPELNEDTGFVDILKLSPVKKKVQNYKLRDENEKIIDSNERVFNYVSKNSEY